MHLHESGEMYLETIYVLTRKSPNVRSIDVAESMGYSKPSVSRAVGLLKSGGYITVAPDGTLALTDIGHEVALRIYERHTILSTLLTKFGVSEDTAANDACKIEHVISQETIDAIKRYVETNNI